MVMVSSSHPLQLPQLPLASLQSEMVSLVSESLGPHPLHWGIQLGTESTIVVEAVAVRMSVVAPQTTTHSLVCKMEPPTIYSLWEHLIIFPVTLWNIQI